MRVNMRYMSSNTGTPQWVHNYWFSKKSLKQRFLNGAFQSKILTFQYFCALFFVVERNNVLRRGVPLKRLFSSTYSTRFAERYRHFFPWRLLSITSEIENVSRLALICWFIALPSVRVSPKQSAKLVNFHVPRLPQKTDNVSSNNTVIQWDVERLGAQSASS